GAGGSGQRKPTAGVRSRVATFQRGRTRMVVLGAMGIVWILGAGFSKPVGGPLLGNLLSPEAERLIELAYPPKLWPELFGDHAKTARHLYWYGFRPSEGKEELRDRWPYACSENLWLDAEQYLDYLDTAATFECPARDRLSTIVA